MKLHMLFILNFEIIETIIIATNVHKNFIIFFIIFYFINFLEYL